MVVSEIVKKRVFSNLYYLACNNAKMQLLLQIVEIRPVLWIWSILDDFSAFIRVLVRNIILEFVVGSHNDGRRGAALLTRATTTPAGCCWQGFFAEREKIILFSLKIVILFDFLAREDNWHKNLFKNPYFHVISKKS